MSSANIEIGISLILKENSAVPAVANLVKLLKELDKVYTGMADPLKALTRETIEGATEQQRTIEGIIKEIDDLVTSQRKLKRVSADVWSASTEGVRRYIGGLIRLESVGKVSEERMTELAKKQRLSSAEMRHGTEVAEKRMLVAKRLGINATFLHNIFEKVSVAEEERSKVQERLKIQMRALTYADKLGAVQLGFVRKGLGLTSDEAVGYARALRGVEGAQARQLVRSQQLRAANVLLKDSTRLEGESLTFVANTYGVSEQAIRAYQITSRETERIKKQELITNATLGNSLFLLSNYTKIQDETTKELIHSLAGGETQAKAYASTLQQLAENQKLNATYNRLMAGSMTPLQRIARQTARELFWTGLGMMFTTMALARAIRNMRQANREATQLAITNINIRRSQEDYNETLREFGRNSEEAREAGYQLRLMQLRQKEQIEDVRASLQQQNLAYVMLIFGMFPTMMRTGALVTETLRGIQVAHLASADATMRDVIAKNIASAASGDLTAKTNLEALAKMYDTSVTVLSSSAKVGSAGASGILAGALKLSTLATMGQVIATQLLIGALTLGVGVAISFAASMYFADQSMKEMERRSKELESELYGGSLYDALYKVTGVTRDLGDEMDRVEFPEVTEMKVIGITEIEELELEDQIQTITQILEPISIERIPDQTYNISAIMGEIPKIENQKQLIIQELRKVDIPLTEDQRMSIIQELLEIDIKEPEDLEQEIVQILIKSDIPVIDNQIQTITQELKEIRVPTIEDKRYNIIQDLIEISIPEVEDKRQRIIQILEDIDLPEIPKEIRQSIIQEIKTIDIPQVENVTQIINQELTRANIPDIEDKEQIIYQRLEGVFIPDIQEKEQLITQILKEVEIPAISDREQRINQILEEVRVPIPEDTVQTIYQVLIEKEIPRVLEQEQVIRQRLESVDIPLPLDLVQIIEQRLDSVRIQKPESLRQIIEQELIEVNIEHPDDISQVIIQRLIETEIEKPEDMRQIIEQVFIENEIPLVENQVQSIYQRLISVNIPDIEDKVQYINQILIEADIQDREDITQRIIQRLDEEEVPITEDQVYNIIQRLIRVRIPRIENQRQVITQELRDINIPIPEEQKYSITQELIEIDISEPKNLEQRITQILEIVSIPNIEDKVQEIEQVLIREDIPQVENMEQNIIQILDKVEIPIPDEIIQTISQRIIEVEIPEVEENKIQFINRRLGEELPSIPKEVVQTIIQNLIETDIEIEDREQIIRQRLIEVIIPEIEDIKQIINQEVIEATIRKPDDMYQTIKQDLIEANIPIVRNQFQNIKQVLYKVDIPETRDKEQRIVQILREANIPDVKDIRQVITQILERVEIEEPDNMNQIITQILKPIEIEEVGDKTYNLSAIVDIPTIPDIPTKTFAIEGVVTRGTDRSILDMENKLTDFNRKIEINKIPGVLETSNINVRHEIPELERGINMEPTRDIRTNNYVNVSFPNLIIREEADIYRIRKEIERIYIRSKTARGGLY